MAKSGIAANVKVVRVFAENAPRQTAWAVMEDGEAVDYRNTRTEALEIARRNRLAAERREHPVIRRLWAVPHQYSCGGHWIAEQHSDGSFMRLSGRMEVLSAEQVRLRFDCCRARFEMVEETWDRQLPEGCSFVGR